MDPQPLDPLLTDPDRRVLEFLIEEIREVQQSATCEREEDTKPSLDKRDSRIAEEISILEGLNDETSSSFEPTVFTNWDQADLEKLPGPIQKFVLQPYIRWARGVVRRQTDVVFMTHIIIYLSTSVPSALYLFLHFSWPHAIAHWVMQAMYSGPFTLLLHNHIHNNGVLLPKYGWFDRSFVYVLEPLMGHTWHSYYYHHLKCHHVEGNGPEDISSTIRYQRDSILNFAMYWGRFMFFVWLELPFYFLRTNKQRLAAKIFFWEVTSYLSMYTLAKYNFWPTLFVFLIPFIQMRVAMMIGNWAQHALVDELDPDSDFRSSITLIDVASNRHCFNDGWHTAHHLNPLRHWRDQPLSYLKAKDKYDDGQALVFQNINYFMMFFVLMRKDYDFLAHCLVPTGDNIGKTHAELVEVLRSKTRAFSEEEIKRKFSKGSAPTKAEPVAKSSGIELTDRLRSQTKKFAGDSIPRKLIKHGEL
ncbi:fatty acid desaturase [Phlyctema vagabunda]|uniref:Fatty acid desaturase n=1 Tax=Phlyctema vagabunda TaxID=108571 RepID=A0ABR4PMK9_9HELO